MIKVSRKFSINGQHKSYKNIRSTSRWVHNSVLYTYEDILYSKGIHIQPISEESFNICYARYKKLGGRKLFHYNLI